MIFLVWKGSVCCFFDLSVCCWWMWQDLEVGYFHSYRDGVDFVFIDSPLFHAVASNIYGGTREVWMFWLLICTSILSHCFLWC